MQRGKIRSIFFILVIMQEQNEQQQEISARTQSQHVSQSQQTQQQKSSPYDEISSALLIQKFENSNPLLESMKRSATFSTVRNSIQQNFYNMGQKIQPRTSVNNIYPEVQNQMKSSSQKGDSTILGNIGFQISPIRQVNQDVHNKNSENKNSLLSSNSAKTNFTFYDHKLKNKNELSQVQRNIFEHTLEQNKYSSASKLTASNYLERNPYQSKLNQSLYLSSSQQSNQQLNKMDQQQPSFYLSLKQQTPSTAKQSMYNNQTQQDIGKSNQSNIFSLSLTSDIYQQKPKNILNSTFDASIQPQIQNSQESSKAFNQIRSSTPIIQSNTIYSNNNSSSIDQISKKDNNQISLISNYSSNPQLPYSNLFSTNKYESQSLPRIFENSYVSTIKNPLETQLNIPQYTPILNNQIEYKSTEPKLLNNQSIENNNLKNSLPEFNYQYSSNSNKSSSVPPIISKQNYLSLASTPTLSSEKHFTLKLNNVQKDSKLINESQILRNSLNQDDTSKSNKDLIIQFIEFKKQEYLNNMNDDYTLSSSRSPQTNKSDVIKRYKATEVFSQLDSYRSDQSNQDKINDKYLIGYPTKQDSIKGESEREYKNSVPQTQSINQNYYSPSSILPEFSRINNFNRKSQDQSQLSANYQPSFQNQTSIYSSTNPNFKYETFYIPQYKSITEQFTASQNKTITPFSQEQILTKNTDISTPIILTSNQDLKTIYPQQSQAESIMNKYKAIAEEQNVKSIYTSHSQPPPQRTENIYTDKILSNLNNSFTITNQQNPTSVYLQPQNNQDILLKISQQFDKKTNPNDSSNSNFLTQLSAQNLQETQIQTFNGLTVSFANNSNIGNSSIDSSHNFKGVDQIKSFDSLNQLTTDFGELKGSIQENNNSSSNLNQQLNNNQIPEQIRNHQFSFQINVKQPDDNQCLSNKSSFIADKKFDRKQDGTSFNNSMSSLAQDQQALTSTSISTNNTTNISNPSTKQSLVKVNEQSNQQTNLLSISQSNRQNTPPGSPQQNLFVSPSEKDQFKKCKGDQDIIQFDIQQRQNDNKRYSSEKRNMNEEQGNNSLYSSPVKCKVNQQKNHYQSSDKSYNQQNYAEGQMNNEFQESENNLQTQDTLRTSQKNPHHVRFDNINQFFNIQSSKKNNLGYYQCQSIQIVPKNCTDDFTQTDKVRLKNISIQTGNQGSPQKSSVFDECTKVFSPRMKLIEPELRENEYMMLNTSQQSNCQDREEQQNNNGESPSANNVEQKYLKKRNSRDIKKQQNTSNGIHDTVLFNSSIYTSHKGSDDAVLKQQQSIYNKIFGADELPAVEQNNKVNIFKVYKQNGNDNKNNTSVPKNSRTYSSQYTDKEKKAIQNQIDNITNKLSPKNQKKIPFNTNKPPIHSNKSLKNPQITAKNTNNFSIGQKNSSNQQLIKYPYQNKQNDRSADKKHINFNDKVQTRTIEDNRRSQNNRQEGEGNNKIADRQYSKQLNTSKPKKNVQSLQDLKQASKERSKSNNKQNGEMNFVQRNKQNVPYMMKNKVEDKFVLFKKAVEYNLTNIVQDQKNQSIKSIILEDSYQDKDQLEEIFQKSLINRSQKNLVSCDSMSILNRSKYSTYQP